MDTNKRLTEIREHQTAASRALMDYRVGKGTVSNIAVKCQPLRDDVAWLLSALDDARTALAGISKFATAHHGQQPSHVLLHSLTVDIPRMADRALQPYCSCYGVGSAITYIDPSCPMHGGSNS